VSESFPVVAVTGSSGAGTTTVTRIFEQIFRREGIRAALVEGDGFHRYDRAEMQARIGEATVKCRTISHFGPEANLFEELEGLFAGYGATGRGRARRYLHDDEEAKGTGLPAGTFTPWEELPPSDLLFYEGLHGGLVAGDVDVARHADLLVGVVPIINLEWIQKIHRDGAVRSLSTDEVVDTILRRMPDYVRYICPQFSRTHVNFQRVPTVDTSNPFTARFIPSQEESFVVIRFQDPKGVDFPYLLSMLHDSFMSRPNSIVVPGGRMELAMQLILTPMILQLMERRRRRR
jgi:phosphoribulokinase